MHVATWQDCEASIIDKFPYKGKPNPVIGTSVRWLSKFGDDGHGYPEYGLRFFTIEPGGQIPIHNHFYIQTMYVLRGKCECWQFDPETDEMIRKIEVGPGSFITVPSMEPHGMANIGKEPLDFLCCICNVYEDEKA